MTHDPCDLATVHQFFFIQCGKGCYYDFQYLDGISLKLSEIALNFKRFLHSKIFEGPQVITNLSCLP